VVLVADSSGTASLPGRLRRERSQAEADSSIVAFPLPFVLCGTAKPGKIALAGAAARQWTLLSAPKDDPIAEGRVGEAEGPPDPAPDRNHEWSVDGSVIDARGIGGSEAPLSFH
jgi:hypothetical protein